MLMQGLLSTSATLLSSAQPSIPSKIDQFLTWLSLFYPSNDSILQYRGKNKMAGQEGLEPPASGFGVRRSIQLELLACTNLVITLKKKIILFPYEAYAPGKIDSTFSFQDDFAWFFYFLLLCSSFFYSRYMQG
jgi:hypothetical protein